MANPAPTINQINAFNATQGTTIDFNIIGGTELVRSNRIYIYDLSDNSLICTHLYASTESIHELPPNTDGSIVYESGKSSADFVNGAQYYAQIQTFTDIAGTEGGSGLSVAKMFWCLADPTLTIATIPSTISTTSYNVSATYNANTSVVSNIIQQYQFSLYSATGSLLQSSGVVVGNGEQQGTSTAYDISYNFTGLSVGSSYYVTIDVTTTQGMSVNAQSGTFTVSIDTPTLGEATVVNNACDGYISVTSNLSSEYGGSGSGDIVSFETDSENVFTKLQVDLEPVQDLNGYDKPWVGGAGVNKYNASAQLINTGANASIDGDTITATANNGALVITGKNAQSFPAGTYTCSATGTNADGFVIWRYTVANNTETQVGSMATARTFTANEPFYLGVSIASAKWGQTVVGKIQLETGSTATAWTPYENICPITGHDGVDVTVEGKNLYNPAIQTILQQGTVLNGDTFTMPWTDGSLRITGKYTQIFPAGSYTIRVFGSPLSDIICGVYRASNDATYTSQSMANRMSITVPYPFYIAFYGRYNAPNTGIFKVQVEEGLTATDYEPYQDPITVSQEFDVSLTPTSKDTDPYLFKAVGDIYGDRLEEDIVGATVNWNQLIEHGNFDEATGWSSAGYGAITVANNIGTLTISDASGSARIERVFTPIVGHKYLAYMDFKPSFDANPFMSFQAGSYASQIGRASVSAGNWVRCIGIRNVVADDTTSGRIRYYFGTTSVSVGDTVQFRNAGLIDLTAMFGTTIADYVYSLEQATAGSGIEWLKSYGFFTKPYYEYDAGTLKSVEATAHVTRGVNAWDEEWEVGTINTNTGANIAYSGCIRSKNYIKVLPNTTYYIQYPNISGSALLYYDEDENFISAYGIATAREFTTPSNCGYVRFKLGDAYGTTYKNDICINISDPTINGKYFPYEAHTYPLGDVTLRGIPKLDANGNLYYDGDEYESDGTVTRKCGTVDLGTLNWTYNDVRFRAQPSGMIRTENRLKGICSKYVTFNGSVADAPDKSIIMGTETVIDPYVYVKDSSYSTAEAFKTAMNGVYLVYKLATPTTETAEPFENIQAVTPNYGTEEFVTTTNVPVGNNTQYYTREIYGGTLDLVSGVLTVDRAMVDLGTLTWSYIGAGQSYARFITSGIRSTVKIPPSNASPANAICEQYTVVGASYIPNTNGVFGIYTDGDIGIKDDSFTSASDFKTAMDGVQLVYELATPQTYQLTPQQIQTLVGVNNVWSEQGNVELSYHIPITNLLVKRQDVDDVSGSWLTLYSQPITQASDMDFTFIDFTNQYGKTYKYALVPLLTQTQSGVEVEVEGGYTVSDEVQSVFDGVFIADSTGSQKCKANVGYGNVDMNQSVGSITPIGSQYPIIVTNSNNRYHNGSISGMIVPDDYYYNGNLSRIDMVNKRNELEQFLTNKRAKIIKDWNSNIWLVMIMDNIDCSFDNNYGMGMVTFNANWLEVGDPTNQQDLQDTGLINVGGV